MNNVKKHSNILLICLLIMTIDSCRDNDETPSTSASLTLIAQDFVSPLLLTEAPDNSGRLFIIDQPGKIYIIKDGQKLTQPFLDISSKLIARTSAQDERGLLGLAFHPDFKNNGRFFVYYSGPKRAEAPNSDHTNRVAEYHVSGTSDQAEVASEKILLTMDHPQSNHNAGMIAFGQDGYLYISVGDGGGGNDNQAGHVAGGNGQDIKINLLGSILRIDINNGTPYGIPSDNPFISTDGLDEIYAYGFRNPYRFSFTADNKIILADAGQELYEEIDLVEKGGNYGWNLKEGKHCFDPQNPTTPPASCTSSVPLVDPVIEFKNSKNFSDGLGNVSVGGFVYQGNDVTSLSGKYIFGVLTQNPQGSNGAIFIADPAGQTDWSYKMLSTKNMSEIGYVLGFGKDMAGEVYVLTNGSAGGKVYKIDP